MKRHHVGVRKHRGTSSGIPFSQACILVWNRPPGNLKTGWQYLYWDGAQWGVCYQLMGTQNPDGTWNGYANTTETSRMPESPKVLRRASS